MSKKLKIFVITPQLIRAPDCRSHAEGQVHYAFNMEVDNCRTFEEVQQVLDAGKSLLGWRLKANKQDRQQGFFDIAGRSRQVVGPHGYLYIQEPDVVFYEGGRKLE